MERLTQQSRQGNRISKESSAPGMNGTVYIKQEFLPAALAVKLEAGAGK
jgi:hypothetical protein